MNLAQITAQYFCGIDLHKKTMYVCVMDQAGAIYLHHNMPCQFDTFLLRIQPYLPDMAVGVEAIHCYYWLFDACQQAGIPFYLGHPLYLKAIHGGKKKNDRLDSQTIADLMRSNHFPLAYPYPQPMRATRDLLRRRHRLVTIRSECYAHLQTAFSQHGIVDITTNHVKSKQNRSNLSQQLQDPELALNIDTDIAHIEFLDPSIRKLEHRIRQQAEHHNPLELSILQTVPGVGDILSLTILYEMHSIDRFPSVQDFCSYARLVKCQRQSVGKNKGGGNQKIGNHYLKWAFGEILVTAQQSSPNIAKCYQRLQSKFGTKRARSIMAHKFGVAIYFMLKNKQPFDEQRFLQTLMK